MAAPDNRFEKTTEEETPASPPASPPATDNRTEKTTEEETPAETPVPVPTILESSKFIFQTSIVLPWKEILKCFFFVVNTLIGISALLILGPGSYAIDKSSDREAADDLGSDSDLDDLVSSIHGAWIYGISAITVGLTQLSVTILGCVGMVFRNSSMLKAYLGVSGLLVIADLFLLCYTAIRLGSVDYGLDSDLTHRIKAYDGKNNLNTYYVDEAQVQLQCCGIKSRHDYDESEWRKRHKGVPLSCCQLKTEDRKHDYGFSTRKLSHKDLLDPTCPENPGSKSHTAQPCLNLIMDDRRKSYVVGIIFTILAMFMQGAMAYVAFSTVKVWESR